MKRNPTYLCTSYFGLNPNFSGIMYPIFVRDGGNIPYIQEIDRDGRITDFLEFTDLEHFFSIQKLGERRVTVGDLSLLAFMQGQALREFDHDEVRNLVLNGQMDLNADDISPLTKVGLSRIAKLPSGRHREIFSQYLTSCSFDSRSVARSVRAEVRANLSMESWWSSIHLSEFGCSEAAVALEHSPVDDVIHWLYENEVNEDWKEIFSGLLRRVFLTNVLMTFS